MAAHRHQINSLTEYSEPLTGRLCAHIDVVCVVITASLFFDTKLNLVRSLESLYQ